MTDRLDAFDTLDVVFSGEIVGALDHTGSARMQFTYAPTATVPLSLALPIQAETFGARECAAVFGGLLPEAGIRSLIERQERVGRGNDFALLKLIGGECAGAISLYPTGEVPAAALTRWHDVDAVMLSEAELAALVEELPRRPLRAGPSGPLRLSLAGAQDKLAIVRDEHGAIGLPSGAAPSTHLMKIGDPAFEGIVEIEAFCLRLAAACGFAAARAEIRNVGDRSVLIVDRFDREIDASGRIARLHQEDACQSLGLVSSTKYEAEGGPSLADVVSLARQHIRRPAAAVLDTVLRAGFHDLVGNADAHGKNWSMLLPIDESQRVRPTPMYDIVATLVWEQLDTRFAMRIGGERRASRIGKEHWLDQARAMGMGPAGLVRQLVAQAEQVLEQAQQLRRNWEPADDAAAAALDRVVQVIDARSAARLAW